MEANLGRADEAELLRELDPHLSRGNRSFSFRNEANGSNSIRAIKLIGKQAGLVCLNLCSDSPA